MGGGAAGMGAEGTGVTMAAPGGQACGKACGRQTPPNGWTPLFGRKRPVQAQSRKSAMGAVLQPQARSTPNIANRLTAESFPMSIAHPSTECFAGTRRMSPPPVSSKGAGLPQCACRFFAFLWVRVGVFA